MTPALNGPMIHIYIFLKHLFIWLNHADRKLGHVGSNFPSKNRAGPPTVGTWSLSHWAIRKIPCSVCCKWGSEGRGKTAQNAEGMTEVTLLMTIFH